MKAYQIRKIAKFFPTLCKKISLNDTIQDEEIIDCSKLTLDENLELARKHWEIFHIECMLRSLSYADSDENIKKILYSKWYDNSKVEEKIYCLMLRDVFNHEKDLLEKESKEEEKDDIIIDYVIVNNGQRRRCM